MNYNEKSITVSGDGVVQAGNSTPSFLEAPTITDEETSYPAQREVLTVRLQHQTRFALAAAPAASSIRSVVLNHRTYFEPDFQVHKKTLVWNRGVLPVGTVLYFEADGADQRHRYKQALAITRNGQTRFTLLTAPRGYEVDVFFNGLYLNSASHLFRVTRNTFEWLGAPLKITDRLVVVFAKTAEGAELVHHDIVPLSPVTAANARLSMEVLQPSSSRMYFRGLRYFNEIDYVVARDDLTLLRPLAANHGEHLTLTYLTDSTYFKKVNETGRLETQVFQTSTRVLSSTPTSSVPVDNPAKKSFLALNGLVYTQDSGYTLANGVLTWTDALHVGVGDVMSLVGFMEHPTVESVKFAEYTGFSGYPTFDLGEKAADIRKSIVVVSAGDTYGGEIYAGRLFLHFPSNRQVTWAGPFALKPTDRVTVIFFKSPVLAARLTLESHQVTAEESGKPFSYTLRRSPAEPASVIAALNGARIVQPVEFIVNDNAVIYHDSVVRVKALDALTFLYR